MKSNKNYNFFLNNYNFKLKVRTTILKTVHNFG